MKYVLLALMMGVFLSSSEAAVLDEVFKDTQVSGTVRYRYEVKHKKNTKLGKKSNKTQVNIQIQ